MGAGQPGPSQFEREIIGERIRDKVAAAKRKGKHTGGPPVLGYDDDYENRRILVNPKEAELVRRIFERFTITRSPLKVALELNADGLITKTWTRADGTLRQGRPWNKSDISRILNNRKYLGEVTHRGAVYKGEHEAIISKRLWDAAHEILKENYRQRSARTRARTPALLKGIVRCGHCGTAMGINFTRTRSRLYRYYLCVHASKSGYDSCPVKSVAAGEIENAVIEQLRRVLRTPELVARTYRAAKVAEAAEVERLKEERQSDEDRLRVLRDMKASLSRPGQAPDGRTAADLTRLENEMEELQTRLDATKQNLSVLQTGMLSERDVAEHLRNLDSVWQELFPDEQVRIVRLLVENVVVNQDGLEMTMHAGGLWSLACELGDHDGSESSHAVTPRLTGDGDDIILRIPMVLKKREGRKEIIITDGFDAPAPADALTPGLTQSR